MQPNLKVFINSPCLVCVKVSRLNARGAEKKIKPSFLTVSINHLGYTTWIKYIQIASLLHTIIFLKNKQ